MDGMGLGMGVGIGLGWDCTAGWHGTGGAGERWGETGRAAREGGEEGYYTFFFSRACRRLGWCYVARESPFALLYSASARVLFFCFVLVPIF